MTSYGTYLLETLLSLGLVSLVAVAVLVGARRLGLGKPRGPVALVGQLALDARRAVYLVKAGPRVLVVGVSEGGMTKLAELDADAMLMDGPPPPPEGSSFRDLLLRKRGAS